VHAGRKRAVVVGHPETLRMLKPFAAELSLKAGKFMPQARTAVVAVPAPARPAVRPVDLCLQRT
jgi:hypothetical protein